MGHYSTGQQAVRLWPTATHFAEKLIEYFKKQGKGTIPLFMYRGMSGVSGATAVMLALHKDNPDFRYGMAYVRKPNEDSHSCGLVVSEWVGLLQKDEKYVPVFIDDFISSGDTFRACVRAVQACVKAKNSEWVSRPVLFDKGILGLQLKDDLFKDVSYLMKGLT